jgi:hypothetical protein
MLIEKALPRGMPQAKKTRPFVYHSDDLATLK